MTWHILGKDLRRLWPYVALLAALHLVMAVVRAKLGPFPDDHPELRGASQLLGVVTGVMVFFAAMMAVQLDPIPDDRQDWLVRPIRRRDLLAAKLLFVILLVQAPMFAADLLQAGLSGFGAGPALGAAAAWNLYQFVNTVLPALALAAMTRTIGQALGLGFAVLAGCAAVGLGLFWLLTHVSAFTFPSGSLVSWLIWTLLLLGGAIAILGLQYFRRETLRSRVIFGVFALLVVASQLLLPESAALAVQAWVAPAPDLSLAFAPQAGTLAAATGGEGPRFSRQNVRISLPLTVNGLPPGLMLVAESVRATLTAPGAEPQDISGPQDAILQMPGRPAAPFHLALSVPKEFFRAHAGQKLGVTLHYRLGLLAPRGQYQMPSSGGQLSLPDGARCTSRINSAGTGVQIGCLQAGEVHTRIAAVLAGGNGEGKWALRHLPSDAPYSNGAEMITQFGLFLPLGDARQLPAVTITTAQPLTHLLREVVIADVRLQDWKADSASQPDAVSGSREDEER